MLQKDLILRLETAIKSPPVDIGVGSQYHRTLFTADQLREKCKNKGLNHLYTLYTDKYELNDEFYYLSIDEGSEGEERENEKNGY